MNSERQHEHHLKLGKLHAQQWLEPAASWEGNVLYQSLSKNHGLIKERLCPDVAQLPHVVVILVIAHGLSRIISVAQERRRKTNVLVR